MGRPAPLTWRLFSSPAEFLREDRDFLASRCPLVLELSARSCGFLLEWSCEKASDLSRDLSHLNSLREGGVGVTAVFSGAPRSRSGWLDCMEPWGKAHRRARSRPARPPADGGRRAGSEQGRVLNCDAHPFLARRALFLRDPGFDVCVGK